jgi:hypothetical protein
VRVPFCDDQWIEVGATASVEEMKINWRRGALRLWIVVSLLWVALVVVVLGAPLNIARPFAAPPVVHVRISDDVIWDYPMEWGVPRIEADLKRWLADVDRKDREWFAQVPEVRKAECGVAGIKQFTHSDLLIWEIDRAIKGAQGQADKDCYRMAHVLDPEDHYKVPAGWATQVGDVPISIWQAIGKVAPWAIGPPLAAMALGVTLFWALAGFKRDP